MKIDKKELIEFAVILCETSFNLAKTFSIILVCLLVVGVYFTNISQILTMKS